MSVDSCASTHSDQCDIGSFPKSHTMERIDKLKKSLRILFTWDTFQISEFFLSQSPLISKQFHLNVLFQTAED